MDFEFSEEQEQLRETVRRFLARHAPLRYVREQYASAPSDTDEVWAGFAELGVPGLLVDEEHLGTGMGMVDAAVVLEEIGRAVYPGPFTSSAIGAVSLVSAAGSPADRADLLPGLAGGTTIGTVAVLEPGRRAAWRDPRTRSRVHAEALVLDGEKTHVANATSADVLLVTATAPEGTLGIYAVDRGAPGLAISATPTVDGTHAEATVSLSAVPARRLGAGDGTDAVAATLDRLAAAAVVDGVGAASRALELSVEYAKERKQFGVPIGSFQAVQHLCADMLRAVELARAAGYYACWACDAAVPSERHRAATMALAFAADELYGVGAAAIQVHGGIGFTWEHDVHLFYKRLLRLQHTGGGAVDQLEELASIALGASDAGSAPG